MKSYSYIAQDARGKQVKGKANAENEQEFLEKMKASLESLDAHNQAALHLTMLQAFETEDGISVLLSYMKNAYSPEMIGRFAQTFTEVTSRLLAARDPKQVRLPDLLA